MRKSIVIMVSLALALALPALLAIGGCASAAENQRAVRSAHEPDHHHAGAQSHGSGHKHAHAVHDHHHDLDDPHGLDHANSHPHHDPAAPCTCSESRTHNGWCRKCNVGYVAGLKVESARLFETLDPHGHDIDPKSLQCPTCRQAVQTNGYCDSCRVGFVKEQAYFTRLTYGLARGRPLDPASDSCPTCRSLIDAAGWCDRCGRGIVGNVAIADRDVYKSAVSEYRTLHAAVNRSTRCELCACAMATHRSCPDCMISYE